MQGACCCCRCPRPAPCLPPPHPACPPQAKRLEELDALYRDEAIMRKKIFNQVRRRLGVVERGRAAAQAAAARAGGTCLACTRACCSPPLLLLA